MTHTHARTSGISRRAALGGLAKLTGATGAQLHCSPMAPQQHCDVVFDWPADVTHR